MRYQLVLQWPSSGTDSYDVLIAIEDSLIEGLSDDCEVDGHDQGADESNIFILCDNPKKIFSEVKAILSDLGDLADLKSAYRDLENNEYCILWPEDLKTFQVS